jgi:hypothetical protein
MVKFVKLFNGVVATILTILGVIFVSFFLNNEITFTSTIFGLIGIGLLSPGIYSWEKIIEQSNV